MGRVGLVGRVRQVGQVGWVALVRRATHVGGLVALCGFAGSSPVRAEPIYSHLRIIAPAAPGGGWDQTARAMQQALQSEGIAGTASVENIPGAAGTIGLARLISAERGKGDVVMVSGLIMVGAIAFNQSLVSLSDVTPIARLTGEYEVVVVPAASPYRTLTDLIDAFRARPESIAWAGGSAGGTDQILAGLIAEAAGVAPRRVNYVAYAGGGESIAAILGGQVTVGISGLGEFAAQIAAGTVRVLAISSAERLPDLNVPTLREQGLDVVLENWRSLVGPPEMSATDRSRVERAVAAMVASATWRETLRRFRWNDRYLAGDEGARFVAGEEARVRSIVNKLGAGIATAAAPAAIGFYPLFVLTAFAICAIGSVVNMMAVRRPGHTHASRVAHDTADRAPSSLRAAALIALAIVLNLALIERAGFIVASIPLFWLTARAFDRQHPVRDLAVGVTLAVSAYLLFARVLQISLPSGGWI